MGDEIVYDEAWDESAEQLVPNPSSGDESDDLWRLWIKDRNSPYFSRIGDRYKPPDHSILLYVHRSVTGNKRACLVNRTGPSGC